MCESIGWSPLKLFQHHSLKFFLIGGRAAASVMVRKPCQSIRAVTPYINSTGRGLNVEGSGSLLLGSLRAKDGTGHTVILDEKTIVRAFHT